MIDNVKHPFGIRGYNQVGMVGEWCAEIHFCLALLLLGSVLELKEYVLRKVGGAVGRMGVP